MSYKLMITQKPTYLHIIVTGLNNKENVTRYLQRGKLCQVLTCDIRSLQGKRCYTMRD